MKRANPKRKLLFKKHSARITKNALVIMYRVMERDPKIRSRTKFAKVILNKKPQEIYKWENGLGYATLDDITKIGIFLKIDFNWLIKHDGEAESKSELMWSKKTKVKKR